MGEYLCSDDASRLCSKVGVARLLVKEIQFKLLKEVLEVMNNGSPLKVKIIEDSQGPMRLVEALDSEPSSSDDEKWFEEDERLDETLNSTRKMEHVSL